MENVKGVRMIKVPKARLGAAVMVEVEKPKKVAEVMLLKCQKHDIEFEGKLLLGKIPIGCPKCKEENEKLARDMEAKELKKKEAELAEFVEFRVKHSGLSKKLIETKAKYTKNFKEFSQHLMSLEKNLFLCGGVGTGKTMFCAELVKRNTHRYPRYFCACDLAYLTNSKRVDLLDRLKHCELFILDEISDIGLIDESFLNALIDKLYNNDCIFVLSGNVSKDFLNGLNTKALSRLNANGLEVCEFRGEDLRIKNKGA